MSRNANLERLLAKRKGRYTPEQVAEYKERLKPVTKDKGANLPHYDPTLGEDVIHQADVLYMPNDKGYRYLLVVADIGTREVDAEPLTTRDSKHIIQGFEKIYRRSVLNKPRAVMHTDPGSEFKNAEVRRYLTKKLGVFHRVGAINRHQQQSVVEAKNSRLAYLLFEGSSLENLAHGNADIDWADDVPDVIKIMNEANTFKRQEPEDSAPPRATGKSRELLQVGDRVRVASDYPKQWGDDKRATGRHRVTDPRWEHEVRTVTQVILTPNRPPMYLVSGITNTSYTKNQLQVVGRS